jgi:hypothetical protein
MWDDCLAIVVLQGVISTFACYFTAPFDAERSGGSSRLLPPQREKAFMKSVSQFFQFSIVDK